MLNELLKICFREVQYKCLAIPGFTNSGRDGSQTPENDPQLPLFLYNSLCDKMEHLSNIYICYMAMVFCRSN